MTTRRIIIVDDHPLLASGLRSELERSGAVVALLDPTVGPAALLDTIADTPPDCAVLDLGLPFPGGGAALISPLAERAIPVVVLTGESERELLARSSAAGARAVLSKAEPLSDIVTTILQVAGGQDVRPAQRAELAIELHRQQAEQDERNAPFATLTPREEQILAGLMDGQTPADLADQHFVSVATVRTQIKSVLAKLEVGSQLQAVAMAHRHHWKPRHPT
ncbi:MAG: response regulator transcription factor [Actinomycetota bacterium]